MGSGLIIGGLIQKITGWLGTAELVSLVVNDGSRQRAPVRFLCSIRAESTALLADNRSEIFDTEQRAKTMQYTVTVCADESEVFQACLVPRRERRNRLPMIHVDKAIAHSRPSR